MKRKILTITYTCPEDKVNLGEADIMGYILQQLGKLGAYDINLKASSAEVREPAAPKVRETGPQIPAFLQERRSRPSRREVLCLPGGGNAYGNGMQCLSFMHKLRPMAMWRFAKWRIVFRKPVR